MTNYEAIKNLTPEEMAAFLELVSDTGGDNIATIACRHCRTTHGSCSFDDSNVCRLEKQSAVIEYWLNMSPENP